MSTSNNSSHEKIQKKKKKKNHRAPHWPGGTPPPQRLELFFSLECGSKLFSQPLQRATTSPQSLGSTEGVEPGGRGAYVTRQTQGQPAGERERTEEWQRKRTKSLHLKGVFSSETRSLALWARRRVKQKSKMQRGKKKKKIRREAEGMSLKALGLLPKNLFPAISKGRNQLRGWGRSFSVIHFWVTLSRHSTKCFFCLQLKAH